MTNNTGHDLAASVVIITAWVDTLPSFVFSLVAQSRAKYA
jgi:hypothetical protein